MSAESSNLEREIFATALDCATTAERNAMLHARCGADASLRGRVEALLQAHADAGQFLEPSSGPPAELVADALVTERLGTQIGRYRLVERIGEGGFGVVYRAEQDEPIRRTVALKVIKIGMDTRAVISRFEAERQALALMDHPAIAKVFDAGATDAGRPYFVMELVAGVPITEFCAEHRLTTRARIELFLQLCEAVQHAHQKGIIHRDLKPSNILVAWQGERPAPKVIDFGIAKATQARGVDQTLFSRLHPFIGTPAYMSPEQAGTGGYDVDTRSDLFSLGVLLYELLTDQLPFDVAAAQRAGLAEFQRVLRDGSPIPPSRRWSALDRQTQSTAAQRRRTEPAKLRSQLRGDLDRIVMKCLEKDRTRRYATSNGLAADLARHLNHEPVLARPDSLGYRSAKFVRRHSQGVVIAALVLVGTIGAIGYHTAQLTRERDRARDAAEKAGALSRLLMELLTASDPYRTRDKEPPTVRSLLDAGVDQVRRQLAARPDLQAEMFTIIGRVYQRLGLYTEARPLLEEALRLAGPLADQPQLLAEAMNDLGVLLAERGDLASAAPMLEQAVALRRNAVGAERELAVSLVEYGRVLSDRGAYEDAEPLLREALALRRRALGNQHRETATSLSELGLLLRQTGDLAGAEQHLAECLEISRETLGAGHPDVGTALSNLALTVLHKGERQRAEEMFREAVEIRREALGAQHPTLAVTLHNLANALREQEKFAEAETAAREAVEITRASLGESHIQMALCSHTLARVYHEAGDSTRAEPLAQQALAIRRRELPDNDWRTASALSLLGGILAELGQRDRAELLLNEAGQMFRDVPGPQARELEAHRRRLAAFAATAASAGDVSLRPAAHDQ